MKTGRFANVKETHMSMPLQASLYSYQGCHLAVTSP